MTNTRRTNTRKINTQKRRNEKGEKQMMEKTTDWRVVWWPTKKEFGRILHSIYSRSAE